MIRKIESHNLVILREGSESEGHAHAHSHSAAASLTLACTPTIAPAQPPAPPPPHSLTHAERSACARLAGAGAVSTSATDQSCRVPCAMPSRTHSHAHMRVHTHACRHVHAHGCMRMYMRTQCEHGEPDPMAVTATSAMAHGRTMRGCHDSPPPRSHSYITATITVQPQPMAAVTHCRRGCIATMTASHAGTAVSCDTVMVTSQH